MLQIKEIWVPRRRHYCVLLGVGKCQGEHCRRDREELRRRGKGYSMQRKWALHTEQTQ